MVDRQQHWESVYRNKAADQVGWFSRMPRHRCA
jgi:hypothetical protein